MKLMIACPVCRKKTAMPAGNCRKKKARHSCQERKSLTIKLMIYHVGNG